MIQGEFGVSHVTDYYLTRVIALFDDYCCGLCGRCKLHDIPWYKNQFKINKMSCLTFISENGCFSRC